VRTVLDEYVCNYNEARPHRDLALDDPERRRVRGLAAQSVFVGRLLAAANPRKIEPFVQEQAALEDGTLPPVIV
jgi:hypothetical protein